MKHGQTTSLGLLSCFPPHPLNTSPEFKDNDAFAPREMSKKTVSPRLALNLLLIHQFGGIAVVCIHC